MSLPKEPRQKMINIMYLVLTALLALNVSSEILNAFKTIDQSLTNANKTIDTKNKNIYNSFEAKLKDPKTMEKASFWAPKAYMVKALSDEMFTYVESLKKSLKEEAGLEIKNGKESFKEDDLDATTRLFLNNKNGVSRGAELFNKLKDFKENLASIDSSIDKELIPLNLTIPNSNNFAAKKDWAYAYFNMTPAVAAITILTKFQNDIRISEAQIIEDMHAKIGEVELVYDQFNAFAASNSQYLMSGEELVITAGVGAFSSAAKPTISIDGIVVPIGSDGQALYKTIAGSTPGVQTKRVVISFLKPNGETARVEKNVQYTIGTPSGLVVSTDKTRVFYKGLPNPLSITGAVASNLINVSVEGAGSAITKVGPGQYMVTCTQTGTTIVTVNDGKQTQKLNIPVKIVPDPVPTVGGFISGNIAASDFRTQGGVIVELKNFVFDGIKFKVVSYTMIATGKGFDEPQAETVNGPAFNSASAILKKCQAGTTITIAGITVLEPGGGRRVLDQSLTYILD